MHHIAKFKFHFYFDWQILYGLHWRIYQRSTYFKILNSVKIESVLLFGFAYYC